MYFFNYFAIFPLRRSGPSFEQDEHERSLWEQHHLQWTNFDQKTRLSLTRFRWAKTYTCVLKVIMNFNNFFFETYIYRKVWCTCTNMEARFDTCTVFGQEGYIFLAVIKKYIFTQLSLSLEECSCWFQHIKWTPNEFKDT